MVSRPSAKWIESRQAMLRSACLPYGDRGLQHLDYVSISDSLLQRRGLEGTKQFQPEGFQILDRLKTHVGRVRRRIVESFDTLTAQPRRAAFFFFRPETNRARSREDTRTHGEQVKRVKNLVACEIYRQVGGNAMYIHLLNIHDFSAADGLPREREPLVRDVLPEKHM